MGSLVINGASNGSMRINYTETINQSLGVSTITVDSIQVLSTNRYQYTFYPYGTIKLGNTPSSSLTISNGSYVGSQNTWVSFKNIPSISASFANTGSGGTATITLGPSPNGSGGMYNDFNIFCDGYAGGSIAITARAYNIELTPYSTDTPSTVVMNKSVYTPGESATFTVTRSSNSYTHTLQYNVSGSWTNIATNVATSYSWTVPTTLTDGAYTARCITYNGSTQVGINTCTFNVKAASSGPTINSITVTPDNSANATIDSWEERVYVKGFSKADIVVSFTLQTGTVLSSCKITCDACETSIISSGTSTTVKSGTLIKSGSAIITATLTDSNGNSGYSTQTINVINYNRPSMKSSDAKRFAEVSCLTEDDEGEYMGAKISAEFSSVVNPTTGTALNSGMTVGARVKAIGGSYPSNIVILTNESISYKAVNYSGSSYNLLEPDKSYMVQFWIYDDICTIYDAFKYEMLVSANAVTVNIPEGGKGISVGEFYDTTYDNECQVNYDLRLTKNMVLPSSMFSTTVPTAAGKQGQLYFVLMN